MNNTYTDNQQRDRKYGCHIRVGTSGYSYAEWVDAGFYPVDTKPGWMLRRYAQQFSVTELNYTWYQMPKPQSVERMRQQVPEDFQFAAKLIRYLTHEVDVDAWRGHVKQYRDGISPLVQADQLAAVLLQFPPSFQRVTKSRQYLAALLDELDGLPMAVEFRHVSWAAESVYAELERRGIALVAVDTPDIKGLFPTIDIVTSPDLFYIRLHGRNTKGWRSGNMQKQFNYDYNDYELREWVEERIEKMAQHTHNGLIFFNNHVQAQAPRNARQLEVLLKDRGLL